MSSKMLVASVLGLVLMALGTWAVTEVAGGTGIRADYSNTPNGVTQGPPDFK